MTANIYKAAEVARVLGCSASTVKNLWTSGRMAFCIEMDGHQGRYSTREQINKYLKTYKGRWATLTATE